MPVAHLLVEGRDVDAVIFAAICAGNPVVAQGGPRNMVFALKVSF